LSQWRNHALRDRVPISRAGINVVAHSGLECKVASTSSHVASFGDWLGSTTRTKIFRSRAWIFPAPTAVVFRRRASMEGKRGIIGLDVWEQVPEPAARLRRGVLERD
jgi:hypothetical protein